MRLRSYEMPPIRGEGNLRKDVFPISALIFFLSHNRLWKKNNLAAIDIHFVRFDMRDLLPENMEAFCEFIFENAAQVEANTLAEGGRAFGPVDLVKGMTNERFAAFWEKCKEKGWKVKDPKLFI